MSRLGTPKHHGRAPVPDELAAVVRAYVTKHGVRRACEDLVVCAGTLDELRDGGLLRADTIARVAARLGGLR